MTVTGFLFISPVFPDDEAGAGDFRLLQADFLRQSSLTVGTTENLPRILPFTSPEIPATHLEI